MAGTKNRKNMKRVIFLLVVTFIMSSVGYAQSIVNSGSIDEFINWTVYDDGTLEITGDGSISDYSSQIAVPWYSNRSQITILRLSGEITPIGKYAFSACQNITKIICVTENPPTLNENTFNSNRLGQITVLVPTETARAMYMGAEYWSQMGSIEVNPENAGGSNPDDPTQGEYYTVYWSVNGEIISEQSVEAGGFIDMTPEAPMPMACANYGYTFVGWTDAPISGSQGWEPSPMYISAYEYPSVSQDVTYYAVFQSDATAGGGTYEMTDVLTREMTGVASGSTNYTEWTGIMASSSAMYAGNTAGGNSAIQMRSSGNNTGIITTASGGTLTQISVEWNSKTTDGQTLNVYGSYTPFSSVSELYSGGSATQIGTLVKGTSSMLPVSGYEYIGMRSNNGALYLNSISITWLTQGAGGTSEYVTSCGGSSTGGDATSGTLENGQSWSLENGRLSLTGAGNIAGFDAPGDAPWYSHRNVITSIFLGADFFSIGGFVFYDLNNLTSISCPSSYMPTLQENTFSPGLLSQITATVRANLLSEYQADPYWSQMTFETYPDSGGDDTPTVYAEGYTGDGDGLHWIIYNNGQMTIDGVGALPDFSDYTLQSWAEFRDQIIDVNLNGQITSVGSYAFAQCQNLNTVLLSSSTNQLGDYAFSECPSLTRITAPAYEVMSSSELAFGNSYDREKLTIEVPESMVDAYKGAMFWYEFKIVAIGSDSTSKDDIVGGLVEGDIRWSFNSNTGLLSIYGFGAMPDWIQSMAPWGSYVDSIQEVEVCYGITYVCNGAFANSLNITKVTLAASVDSIGEYIFTGNYSPIQLYVQNMTPPGITTNTFANVNGCVYAYCYESAFPAYDSKPLWNEKVCLGFDTDPEDPNLQSYQLQMIYINNVALADFNPDQYSYNITLPADSETPLVTYKPGYTSQSITIEQASSTDGTAYIHVNESATYSLYFGVEGGGEEKLLDSGDCGPSVYWDIYESGLLIIKGSGTMYYWPEYQNIPWDAYRSQITSVQVQEGVESLTVAAFLECVQLSSATLPSSLCCIDDSTFYNCVALRSIACGREYPPSVNGTYPFYNVNLSEITLTIPEVSESLYSSAEYWGQMKIVAQGGSTSQLEPYQLEYIFVNSIGIDGFNPGIYNYDVVLPAGSTTPKLSYMAGNNYQVVEIEQPTSPNSTAYIHVSVNGSRQATYTINFTCETRQVEIALSSDWRFIMLPSGALAGNWSYNDITTTGDVIWARYNGEKRAAEQSGWTIVDIEQSYYKDWGHIVRAQNGTATLSITMTAEADSSAANIHLRTYEARLPQNASWNLIGNPYNASYDIKGLLAAGITAPIHVWNGTGYTTYNPEYDDYTLQPFEAFFVQTSGTETQSIHLSPEYIVGNGGNGGNTHEQVEGELSGAFSIGESMQVHFSKGNLQYNANSNIWRFAESQYDYIGEENTTNISDPTNGGWIDLFGWGTGDNPTRSTQNGSQYSEFTDWGINPILNGGNIANIWQTLKSDEWTYLLQSRANAQQLQGVATVNGYTGLILLPDNWYDTGHTALVSSYTSGEWETMENAGAVFLPAAGYRWGSTKMFEVGVSGEYWSASFGATDEAYDLDFKSDSVNPMSNYSREYGFSVRLVRQIQ